MTDIRDSGNLELRRDDTVVCVAQLVAALITVHGLLSFLSTHIRKEGQQAMHRDEDSYQLSHAYTTAFLTRRLPVVSRTGSTSFLMKASDRGRNVKF